VGNKHNEGLVSYLLWGLAGAVILSIFGWIQVILRTMGPEYTRRLEIEFFIPLIVLILIGFLTGCGLKWVYNKLTWSK
jgi:hypothetical protein